MTIDFVAWARILPHQLFQLLETAGVNPSERIRDLILAGVKNEAPKYSFWHYLANRSMLSEAFRAAAAHTLEITRVPVHIEYLFFGDVRLPSTIRDQRIQIFLDSVNRSRLGYYAQSQKIRVGTKNNVTAIAAGAIKLKEAAKAKGDQLRKSAFEKGINGVRQVSGWSVSQTARQLSLSAADTAAFSSFNILLNQAERFAISTAGDNGTVIDYALRLMQMDSTKPVFAYIPLGFEPIKTVTRKNTTFVVPTRPLGQGPQPEVMPAPQCSNPPNCTESVVLLQPCPLLVPSAGRNTTFVLSDVSDVSSTVVINTGELNKTVLYVDSPCACRTTRWLVSPPSDMPIRAMADNTTVAQCLWYQWNASAHGDPTMELSANISTKQMGSDFRAVELSSTACQQSLLWGSIFVIATMLLT